MRLTIARAGVVVAALAVLVSGMGAWADPSEGAGIIEIDAPQAKVWAVIGNFQDMSWLAGVSKTEGEKGTRDRRHAAADAGPGVTIEEELSKYRARDDELFGGRVTAVDVKVLPVTNYSSTLEVSPAPGGKANAGMVRRVLSRLPQQRSDVGAERRGRDQRR